MKSTKKIQLIALFAVFVVCNTVTADQVILDDLIADGSFCAGQDCVNGESFGFDTIRIKENNTRISFIDTSSTSSFPSVDWRIKANDSSNGGGNFLAIENADTLQVPFKVMNGATSDALLVAADDNVGLGTSIPETKLHLVSGNSPSIRFEQNGTDGYTPYAWGIGGNEGGFYVRDTTGSDVLPFRIRPDSPAISMDISADGIGFGTSTPDGNVHVFSDATKGIDPLVDGTMVVENTQDSAAPSMCLVSKSNGQTVNALVDTSTNTTWYVKADDNGYEISLNDGTSSTLLLDADGNLNVDKVISDGSSRATKKNFKTVDTSVVLDKVATLPLTYWEYKTDAKGVTHIGPMAEDFHSTFKVGKDGTHLASLDSAGVALASIQALNNKLEKQNSQLQSDNEKLQKRLAKLEAAVNKLTK